jgi:hypothetical protein
MITRTRGRHSMRGCGRYVVVVVVFLRKERELIVIGGRLRERPVETSGRGLAKRRDGRVCNFFFLFVSKTKIRKTDDDERRRHARTRPRSR